jgi:hypothetical protein
MNKRGRPPRLERPLVFRLTLRLQPALHANLIAYLQRAPLRLRSQYVIRAMQSGVESTPAPLTETPEDDLAFGDLWQ